MGQRGPVPNRSRYKPCGLAHPRHLLCQEKTACVVRLGDPTCTIVNLVQDLRRRTRRPIHVPKNARVAPTFARTTPTPDRRSALLLDHADRRTTAVLQHEVGQLIVKTLGPRTAPNSSLCKLDCGGRLRAPSTSCTNGTRSPAHGAAGAVPGTSARCPDHVRENLPPIGRRQVSRSR